jgi:Fur family peroxide stress response transcriptional regulator
LTPQRLAIVKIPAHSEGHPSVEKIYQQLHDDFPTMSLATVYKTVSLVKDLGELLELGFSDGSNRYDGNRPYPHPHAICVRCKKIDDPDLASLAEIKEEVTAKTGFQIMVGASRLWPGCFVKACRFFWGVPQVDFPGSTHELY